jgi:hypothetical protein
MRGSVNAQRLAPPLICLLSPSKGGIFSPFLRQAQDGEKKAYAALNSFHLA